ncbi:MULTISPECIES: hypothetical protein [unclassified Micromonospora]|uniref:hypothetical protein n=1 Tax=unclassified Micromonospora TaxID=2617518 RepID=UPI002FF0D8C7
MGDDAVRASSQDADLREADGQHGCGPRLVFLKIGQLPVKLAAALLNDDLQVIVSEVVEVAGELLGTAEGGNFDPGPEHREHVPAVHPCLGKPLAACDDAH